jgi:hypothetical protein
MKIKRLKKFLLRLNVVQKVEFYINLEYLIYPFFVFNIELLRRQKEISKGKLSKAYEAYISAIPR